MECEGETPRILLIVEYYTHVDDGVMAQNMTCLVGTPVHDQTVTLPHGVCPYWVRGPGAHFGSITFFCSMIFGQVMAKIRHGGGGSCTEAFWPFSEDVWCGVFGGDKRVKSYTNSYKFAKTKKLAQYQS